ncbi:MAG: hypothetical protein OXU36_09185 [Candidatus Poribacteria bacterium]|nr:hypothetical protein [Candidatus Poribacteria bacterium]
MKRNLLITPILVVSIIGLSLSLQSCSTNKINLRNILDTRETIQVQAYWDPIADASLGMPNSSPKHEALFNNLSPAHPSQEYEMDAFKAFLLTGSVPVGHVWELDVNEVLPFLRQFHSGATSEMHINPGGEAAIEPFGWRIVLIKVGLESEGAFACLRALSPTHAEIVFRIHAEFQLDKEARAYFTPAQFTGRLILNRNNGTIRDFWLHLPPRNTNVDINAFGSADMVFVPRMELIGQNTYDKSDIVWETAITENEAKDLLEAPFYKFSEIERLPIEEAVAQAQAENRPIHVVLTWGVFDAESC